jgi:hypothetical protein
LGEVAIEVHQPRSCIAIVFYLIREIYYYSVSVCLGAWKVVYAGFGGKEKSFDLVEAGWKIWMFLSGMKERKYQYLYCFGEYVIGMAFYEVVAVKYNSYQLLKK